MANFVGFPSVPSSLRSALVFSLGLAVVACATANDQGTPLPDGSGGTVDTGFGGTATGAGSGGISSAGSGTSGASPTGGTGTGGQSSGGASGSSVAFGGTGGSGFGGAGLGGTSSGGSSTFGGNSGHSGTGSAGSGSGGTGVAIGGSAGMTGSAGTGTAGTTGSAGSGGTTGGGTGCNAPGWINGFAYQSGAVVTATCQDVGGGTTVCTSGKKYPWTCFGSQCSFNGPGVAGWWGNWTIGTACN